MANRSTANSIDEYIAGFPPETQKVLEELRALIKASAPDATETISYAIPTFDLNGKHLVHFAGYERHVGLYPAPSGLEAFKKDLRPYLIHRIVEFRVEQNTGNASKIGRDYVLRMLGGRSP